jgi:EpsD family peptidyl-prolyl cis-trans isomerase
MNPKSKLIGVVVASLVLASCGKGDKKAASQVAARVNDAEITVLQVNNALSRVPNLPPEAAAGARRQVLDQLVDQELAVGQAMEKKLDRNPEVMTAIEAAKREILARAYLQQLVAAQGKPADEDVKKYYREHPELFEQRKVFSIEQIALPKNAVPGDQLAALTTGKAMNEIAAELKRRGVKFNADAGVRPAEQLPLEMLPHLATMKDNQTSVVPLGDAVLVVHVIASRAAPVSEADATPRIQQFLGNQKAMAAVKADLQQLKDKAKIEYLGEFAGGATGEKPAAPTTPAKAGAAPDDLAKGVAKLQ